MATAKEKQEAQRKAAADAAATAAGKPTSEQIEALNRETTLHPDKVANAHGKQMKVGSAGEKCFVGLKVGFAYLDLQLSRLVEQQEQTQTGTRTIKIAERFGPVVRIRGTAYPRGTVPDGFPEKPLTVNGCAINPGVDKDFMRAWLKLNEQSPIVTNRMIFIADTEAEAMAMARELSGELSGFDPVNPKGDSRIPRSTNKDVGQLEPGKTTVA